MTPHDMVPCHHAGTTGSFAQTTMETHEAWARLAMDKPGASALLHMLVSRMDRTTNAVVASHNTLAKLMGVSTRSIKNWLTVLEDRRWVQKVSLGPGAVNAYVINPKTATHHKGKPAAYSS